MNITDILPIFGQYTPPTAMVVVVVLFILTGKLIPKITMDTIIADRDKWRENFWELMEANKIQAQANSKLVTQAETTTKLITSLPTPEELKEGEPNEN